MKETKKGKKKGLAIISILIFILCAIAVMVYVLSKRENKTEKIYATSEVTPRAIDTSTWDTSRITIVTDTDGAKVPVPQGYVASQVPGENRVNTGFVIYEGTNPVTNSNKDTAQRTRNQWVWVPVSNLDRIFRINELRNGVLMGYEYKWETTGRVAISNERKFAYGDRRILAKHYFMETEEMINKTLEIEFVAIYNSIEKYGGFYIGRYETGDVSKKIPVVQKMKDDCLTDLIVAYDKVQYLSANENVKTNILLNCLYDETMQWLIESGCKTYSQVAVDSSLWGNYNNTRITYTDMDGTTRTKTAGTYLAIPTGSSSQTVANNIYDLAGNLYELTLQANRGGYYIDDYNSATNYAEGAAFSGAIRACLYIK